MFHRASQGRSAWAQVGASESATANETITYSGTSGYYEWKVLSYSGSGSYTASPVAADGRLYFASEQGEVRVVKAGPAFELLAVNELGDYCLATPAISDGALFIRSQQYLWAVGAK